MLCALRANAAMVRVLEVRDGRTIVIDRNGARETVTLSGVELTDAFRARELLQWTIGGGWVMVEGDGLVYRSPDALFVNRELVLRGFARATQPGIAPYDRLNATYLGEVDPSGAQRAPSAPSTKAPATRTPRSTSDRPRDAPGRARATPRPRRRAQ